MVEKIVRSVNGKPIRYTLAAIEQIELEHPELRNQHELICSVLGKPDIVVVVGRLGELSAIRKLKSGRRLVVVYRELKTDGFVITAFFIRTSGYYERREQIWP